MSGRGPRRRHPGQMTGAPNEGVPERLWKEAILRAVKRKRRGDDQAALDKLAHKLVDNALEGDTTALKEIGGWLDGKPNQTADKAPGGELISALARIRRARTARTGRPRRPGRD